MRFIDLSHDPVIPVFAEMLREMSGATTSAQALGALLRAFSLARPVRHVVGVAPEPGRPGFFRLLHSMSIDDATRTGDIPNRLAPPEVLATLPLRSGGIIAELIGKNLPRIAVDLDVKDDPVLGHAIRPYSTCMAVPVFIDGRVRDWALGFAGGGQPAGPADALQTFMTVNLVANANRSLDAANIVRALNGRLTRELEQIARLQQALLPAAPPKIPGLAIATSYLTSDQSGGDYYDFFELPGGVAGSQWGILIADVSGHGAAAATVMAMMHAIVHSFCAPALFPEGVARGGAVPAGNGLTPALDPAALLRFANARLFQASLEGSFVTAFFGLYDPSTAVMRYANCGHPPPRLLRADSRTNSPDRSPLGAHIDALPNADGVPLGILDDLTLSTSELRLTPGDALVLYTDGISEVFSPSREMFGLPRLDAAILEANRRGPDEVIESIHCAVFNHRESATRDDDQTIVVLQRGTT